MQEWNSHQEIFSHPQILENSRQYLLPRTDILQKTVVGVPLKMDTSSKRIYHELTVIGNVIVVSLDGSVL